MPEGHVIHRLAQELNSRYRGKALHVTSPQGRFAGEAAVIDQTELVAAEAFGKHLFVEFAAATRLISSMFIWA